MGPSVDGLVVMTWAFHAFAKQAYNPGSNPGRRIILLLKWLTLNAESNFVSFIS